MTVARLRRTDSALLFHARYTDGVVTALTGQADSFSRAGDGYALASNGLYLRAAHSRPRFAADVNDVVGLLMEASQENLALQAANLDDSASPWQGHGDFSIEAVTSVIAGQTAHKHTNTSGSSLRPRVQDVGTLSAASEIMAVIMENVDATDSRFGILDQTAGARVGFASYEWATGTLAEATPTTAGTVGDLITVVLGDGPSGGDIVLLAVVATPDTAGNSRRLFAYPNESSAAEAAILHFAGLVEDSFLTSPIVTAGASVTRAAEELAYVYNVPATKPWSGWVRFIYPPAGSPALFRISSVAPDLLLDISGGEVRVVHDNNSSTVSSTTSGLGASQGDVVDARVRFGSDGKVTVGASVNEAAETTGSQSAALAPATWGSAELYPGGLSAEMARVILREIKVHPDPDLTMSQLRGA